MSNRDPNEKAVDLLEKLLAVQLHSMSIPQGKIAKIVGKSKTWVNALLKGVPAIARASDGEK